MIEMRWAEVMQQHRDGYQYGPIKVLQYRYRQPKETDRIDAYPPRDWEWSEWKEVAG